jgi:hypothetical protein
MSRRKYIHLEPIALIGHDGVLTRGQSSTFEGFALLTRVATKEEQEVTVACKVIIQNAIVLWNYLYLSQILVNTDNPQEKMRVLDTIRQGSLISWGHVNMQGEYDFTRASNEPMFDMNKILSLKIPSGEP